MRSPKSINWIYFILKNLFRLLPLRSKRAVYLTSLYFYLANKEIFRNVTISHFLRANNIEMTPTGVKLPLFSKEYIWEETNVDEIIKEDHCFNCSTVCPSRDNAIRLSERVVESTPNWLCYNRDEMVKDTVRLFFLRK